MQRKKKPRKDVNRRKKVEAIDWYFCVLVKLRNKIAIAPGIDDEL